MVKIKRVYDDPEPEDGLRLLVDRLWPRGVAKEKGVVDWWLKELAPSTELRRWFGHDPARWGEFKGRYLAELEEYRFFLEELRRCARTESFTLLFGAKDPEHNNAAFLKEFLEGDLSGLEAPAPCRTASVGGASAEQ